MEDKRWKELELNPELNLTEVEIRERWHRCPEWDYLLIGPGMAETEVCACYEKSN